MKVFVVTIITPKEEPFHLYNLLFFLLEHDDDDDDLPDAQEARGLCLGTKWRESISLGCRQRVVGTSLGGRLCLLLGLLKITC